KQAREIFGCRRVESREPFLARRRSAAIKYRIRASRGRRSARKKAPQSDNNAGRFVEGSKTSSGLVLSAFRISPLETLGLYLGGLDDPARKRFHGSWWVRFALKKTRSFDALTRQLDLK